MFSLSSPRFVCKNNGVLFENQLLQIGLKSEFRQNLGKSFTGEVVSCLHYQPSESMILRIGLTFRLLRGKCDFRPNLL